MNVKAVCFIGHRNVKLKDDKVEKLKSIIENLIIEDNIQIFLFGSRSDFDYICQNKYDEVARMALIGEWENWFALNKAKILKKRECKKMNWGKNVAL